MTKIKITGKDEKGIIQAEAIPTAVCIEQLIHDMWKLSKFDIHKRLCEIRESAERDDRIRHTYAAVLKKRKTDSSTGSASRFTSGNSKRSETANHSLSASPGTSPERSDQTEAEPNGPKRYRPGGLFKARGFEPGENFREDCAPVCANCKFWESELFAWGMTAYCRFDGEATESGDLCKYRQDD